MLVLLSLSGVQSTRVSWEQQHMHRALDVLAHRGGSRATHDVLGNPLLPSGDWIRPILRDGEVIPDMSLEHNKRAFDNYVDNLLQGRVVAEQHGVWDWAKEKYRDTKRVVGAGVDAVVSGVKTGAQYVADKAKAGWEAASAAYSTLTNLGTIREGFNRMRTFVDNIGGILQSFGQVKFFDLFMAILIGLVNGFTMGSAGEFIRNLAYPPGSKPPKPPPNPLIEKIKVTFRACGEKFSSLFKGTFGDDASRGGKSRIDFIKAGISAVVSAAGDFFLAIFRFLSSDAVMKAARPIIFMIIGLIIFTVVLFAFPGLGWLVKLATMIITILVALKRLFTVVIPRFLALLKSCWDKSKCTPTETARLVENVMDIIGMGLAVFLAGKPDQGTNFGGFNQKFDSNTLSKALDIKMRPSFAKELLDFKSVVNAENGGGVLQALKNIKNSNHLSTISMANEASSNLNTAVGLLH